MTRKRGYMDVRDQDIHFCHPYISSDSVNLLQPLPLSLSVRYALPIPNSALDTPQ